jgi:hypothetical protein
MPSLADEQLVRLWELGEGRHAVDRALLLLLAADPEATLDDVAQLTVGQRNYRLLQLRAGTFGPKLAAAAACPNCGEQLQFSIHVDELRQPQPETLTGRLAVDGFEVAYRLPDSRDLAAIAGLDDVSAARELLLERCVTAVQASASTEATMPAPGDLLKAVAEAINRHDPMADIWLELACPNCDHEWEAQFDIATYFWRELSDRAQRLMYDVSRLAAVYGWTEGQALALGPVRRQTYLELAGQ